MGQGLHKQATTTPNVRAAIQAGSEPAWLVAKRNGISGQTVWKWRTRNDLYDRSQTPRRLQTTLAPAQEAVAVALRKALFLPSDDPRRCEGVPAPADLGRAHHFAPPMKPQSNGMAERFKGRIADVLQSHRFHR